MLKNLVHPLIGAELPSFCLKVSCGHPRVWLAV